MAQDLDEFGTARLEQYLDRLGTHLKDHRKRESFAIYAFGILGESARKSVEPIAALACPDPEFTKKMHDKLLHFVAHSEWSDEQVRLEATRYVCFSGHLRVIQSRSLERSRPKAAWCLTWV